MKIVLWLGVPTTCGTVLKRVPAFRKLRTAALEHLDQCTLGCVELITFSLLLLSSHHSFSFLKLTEQVSHENIRTTIPDLCLQRIDCMDSGASLSTQDLCFVLQTGSHVSQNVLELTKQPSMTLASRSSSLELSSVILTITFSLRWALTQPGLPSTLQSFCLHFLSVMITSIDHYI